MKEKILLKTALICSVIGILILYFMMNLIDINDSKVIISASDEGQVKLSGVVEKIYASTGRTLIALKHSQNIDIIIFKNISGISSGERIDITGKASKKEGKLEIIADQIIRH